MHSISCKHLSSPCFVFNYVFIFPQFLSSVFWQASLSKSKRRCDSSYPFSLSRELKRRKQLTWGGGQVIKNAPTGLPVNLNPSKERKLITWEELTGSYVWSEDVGEPIICRREIWLSFSSQIETDMYSGVKIHVIKFAKGIDYVSCLCFPQEEAVMAWTSKTDVKSDCPSFCIIPCSNIICYIYLLIVCWVFNKRVH